MMSFFHTYQVSWPFSFLPLVRFLSNFFHISDPICWSAYFSFARARLCNKGTMVWDLVAGQEDQPKPEGARLLDTITCCCTFLSFFNSSSILSLFLKRFYLFLEIGEGREKEGERNINVWLPLTCSPTRDQSRNQCMCPDQELNQWPCGSQAGTQPTEPHQPGPVSPFHTCFCVLHFA